MASAVGSDVGADVGAGVGAGVGVGGDVRKPHPAGRSTTASLQHKKGEIEPNTPSPKP